MQSRINKTKRHALDVFCMACAFALVASAALAAPRTGPWTKERAWEWYNAQPWIRGCNNKLPHAVALAWMEHCLKLWKSKNLGWALWNLRGRFGIMDSGRADVAYEDFHGHKLDRGMLELLRRY